MMMHMDRITPIVKLNLKRQCKNQVYGIAVMRTYS